MKPRQIKRGDIYYANLNPVMGCEQGDTRPCLVVQNNTGNKYSPTIVVVPITRSLKKTLLPTHVIIPFSSGITDNSLALVEQIRTIDRSRLYEYIGRIDGSAQSKIDAALVTCVGIEKHRAPKGEMLTLCLCRRCENDFRDSGYLLIKRGWQDVKSLCDFCRIRNGLVFGIFDKKLLPAQL